VLLAATAVVAVPVAVGLFAAAAAAAAAAVAETVGVHLLEYHTSYYLGCYLWRVQ